MIIGERPEERQARKVETLAHHLHACNPKALMSAVMAGASLQGILIASSFELDDALQTSLLTTQAAIHEMTRRVRLPDESIEVRVRQMKLPPDVEPKVVEVMRQMRDILTGQYAEPTPAPGAGGSNDETPPPTVA